MVAKVEFHFGELCPRVGFIVTNFQTSNRAVVRFCDQRATAEHLRRLASEWARWKRRNDNHRQSSRRPNTAHEKEV